MKKQNVGALVKARTLFNNAAVTLFFMLGGMQMASAQGLQKGKGILEKFNTELTTIIPVVATIILVLLAIGYAWKMVEKDTFVRWGVGVLIAGSAAQIVALFFTA